MNILWLCGSRIAGGAERATLQIAALLRDRGHAVQVACPPDSRVVPLCGDLRLPVQAAPLGGGWNVRAPAAIRKLIWSKADVVMATGAHEWVWASLSQRPPNTRLVLVRHMALPLSRRVRWLAARRADAVVAVSHAVRDSLAGRPTIPADRLHVIYNPVRFAPRTSVPSAADRARARTSLGLPDGGKWVAFFGGLDANKGIDDVAAAVRRAETALGAIRLLLCGRGERSGEADQALSTRFGLDGRLHDLGETDRVEEALTAADLVVMATRRRLSEALPATLIEAMACGTPVLAYASGGMAEVIGPDGAAGRLARADDAADLARVLVEILTDPAGAARMAAAALARVRSLFDPQQAAQRYERLFSTLCSIRP